MIYFKVKINIFEPCHEKHTKKLRIQIHSGSFFIYFFLKKSNSWKNSIREVIERQAQTAKGHITSKLFRWKRRLEIWFKWKQARKKKTCTLAYWWVSETQPMFFLVFYQGVNSHFIGTSGFFASVLFCLVVFKVRYENEINIWKTKKSKLLLVSYHLLRKRKASLTTELSKNLEYPISSTCTK